jgi:hypothetical protein
MSLCPPQISHVYGTGLSYLMFISGKYAVANTHNKTNDNTITLVTYYEILC